jgi:hypothetical protein
LFARLLRDRKKTPSAAPGRGANAAQAEISLVGWNVSVDSILLGPFTFSFAFECLVIHELLNTVSSIYRIKL